MLFQILIVLTVVTMGQSNLSDFFPDIGKDLTKVTWAHAVNNQSLLKQAFDNKVMMLEADISMGTLIGSDSVEKIPIMAHPTADPNDLLTSDLSLEQFLKNVTEFNEGNLESQKGVKLDFKGIAVFNESIEILQKFEDKLTYPVWLNADIIQGPVDDTKEPVDANQFIENSKQFPNFTLSLGWTTRYDKSLKDKSYTDEQIIKMLDVIKKIEVKQIITFPVRAGLAAESKKQMLDVLNGVPGSTLTIWSSADDEVNVDHLRSLILDDIGLEKVYVDVPEKLASELNLHSSSNQVGNIGLMTVLLATIVRLVAVNAY